MISICIYIADGVKYGSSKNLKLIEGSIMPHPPRKAKRAKIMAHKPSGTEGRVGSGSLVVLTPAKTQRGKIFYKEADATPYYELSDDEEGTSKRKPSKTPKDSIPIDPAPLRISLGKKHCWMMNLIFQGQPK